MVYPARWNTKNIQKVEQLYRSGLSVRQVAEKMHLTHASINHAMRRYHLKRRTPIQTNRIQFYRSPLSFNPKKKLTPKENQLKTAGLMLYWGEGGKSIKSRHFSVDFANSNPDMVKLFIKFLRKIYQVNESRLRCLLYCYPSHNVKRLVDYWSNITKIPIGQFTKPYVRKDGGNIRDKMEYGLIHIRYTDKRLLELILKEIRLLSYNL